MPDSTIARPRRRVRGLRAFAIAALGLAAALPAAHAGCKYKRLGSIPLTWRGLVPTVEARLNGTPVKALVDTGGEAIIVSEKLADELHLHQRWTGQLWHGVGGESRVYDARVKQLVVGGFVWDDANVVVASDLAPSTPQVVLGASFLLQHDMEMTADAITFFEPSGCEGVSLAWWDPDAPFLPLEAPAPGSEGGADKHLYGQVVVNGRPVRAMIDTGATGTAVDVSVARALGLKLPEKAPTTVVGLGRHAAREWPWVFDSVAVGAEVVHHAHIAVDELHKGLIEDDRTLNEDDFSDEEQMLLGADFLKAHHVLFAVSQHRMYFSYTGGEIFAAPTQATGAPIAAERPAAAASQP
ncbi:MAG TPA: retropepsin-like aspartic protease [Burkholderiaceae bacterium]|jgi:predicted aspartyl protease|nr:retropepsin-like aspartic protease [Burkholderiaceae bacterium]